MLVFPVLNARLRRWQACNLWSELETSKRRQLGVIRCTKVAKIGFKWLLLIAFCTTHQPLADLRAVHSIEKYKMCLIRNHDLAARAPNLAVVVIIQSDFSYCQIFTLWWLFVSYFHLFKCFVYAVQIMYSGAALWIFSSWCIFLLIPIQPLCLSFHIALFGVLLKNHNLLQFLNLPFCSTTGRVPCSTIHVIIIQQNRWFFPRICLMETCMSLQII